ncbi:C5a anaphylatoxin chemotactic receptor 1 [Eublepharis macularius]|uniref:C5a anaphylatoxin chemotactic receptor 1 n=1 Tax=Eublepharis macularius TaxID=481883 RepID=A0AA97LH20_EUBMA|nr:C5a anaphylatoxin chemotactic receptor 1 [Eublepharis macularius]
METGASPGTEAYDYPTFTAPEMEGVQRLSPVTWAALVLYGLVSLLGALGNGAVLFVMGFQMRPTVNTVWFLNLAVADLLCCLALPFLIVLLAGDYHWSLGDFACKFFPSLTILNMFASILLLTVISMDRCALVVKPVWCQNHRSRLLALALCGAAWALAALLTLPSFIIRTVKHDQSSGKTTCRVDYSLLVKDSRTAEVSVAVMRFVFAFLVPLAVISVCYGLLLCRVRSSRFMRSQKTLMVVLAVIAGFFVCWAPYHVAGLILASEPQGSPLFQSVSSADPLIVGLACLNSCINPIIYVIAGQDFRGKAKHSLRAVLRNLLSEEAALAEGPRQATCTTEDRSASTGV